eukprot:31346-Pelagococcus_subviridis.AAC.11
MGDTFIRRRRLGGRDVRELAEGKAGAVVQVRHRRRDDSKRRRRRRRRRRGRLPLPALPRPRPRDADDPRRRDDPVVVNQQRRPRGVRRARGLVPDVPEPGGVRLSGHSRQRRRRVRGCAHPRRGGEVEPEGDAVPAAAEKAPVLVALAREVRPGCEREGSFEARRRDGGGGDFVRGRRPALDVRGIVFRAEHPPGLRRPVLRGRGGFFRRRLRLRLARERDERVRGGGGGGGGDDVPRLRRPRASSLRHRDGRRGGGLRLRRRLLRLRLRLRRRLLRGGLRRGRGRGRGRLTLCPGFPLRLRRHRERRRRRRERRRRRRGDRRRDELIGDFGALHAADARGREHPGLLLRDPRDLARDGAERPSPLREAGSRGSELLGRQALPAARATEDDGRFSHCGGGGGGGAEERAVGTTDAPCLAALEVVLLHGREHRREVVTEVQDVAAVDDRRLREGRRASGESPGKTGEGGKSTLQAVGRCCFSAVSRRDGPRRPRGASRKIAGARERT